MKNISKLLIVLTLAFNLIACQDEPDRILFTGNIIYFTEPSASLLENSSEPASINIELSRPAQSDITVTFSIRENGAVKDVDYSLAQTTVLIAAGQSSATIEIEAIDNDVLDNARSFVLALESVSVSDIEVSAENEVTVNLVNDDCPVKTGIWIASADNNAYEVGFDFTYTATFGPNENGDCNVLLVYNIGDLGGDAGVTINFMPDSEGATFGTVTIDKQGTGSFGSSGERTVEGTGTYNETTKLIEIFYTFYFGDGSVYYSDDVVFDGN